MSGDIDPPSGDEAVNEVIAASNGDSENLSLETLILLINTHRLKDLRTEINKEFAELKQRQDKVTFLHNLLKKINNDTSATGELDYSKDQELKDLIVKAKDMGVEIPQDKHKYTKEERERLVDNIRMTIEDYNVSNDMQLQAINRLTNERYESYQLARSILKPLHEAKMQSVRGISK